MQLKLPITALGWGGRRVGAGRKRGVRPRVPHLRRARFSRSHPCHLTLCVREDVPSLRNPRFVREAEATLRAACNQLSFRLVQYSLQTNHVHLMVEADGAEALGRGMKSIGARLARAVNRVFARRGPVLAERYHLHILRTPREVRNALAYVLLNVRKHLGRRASVDIDPASSGRWFDGWRGSPRRFGPDPPAVASPRTWLLSVGWRRHPLLRPEEIPGPRAS